MTMKVVALCPLFFVLKSGLMPQYTYNGVTVTATKRRPSSRDDKKYMRTVTVDGKDYLVHYGDPNMEMQRDIPERRQAFLERHSCSTKKDPLAPGYWACLDWSRTDEKSADIDETEDMASKAGRRNNRTDRQRINEIRRAATGIVTMTNEMEPDEDMAEDDGEMKAVQIDPNAHRGAMVALMLTPEQHEIMSLYRVGDTDDSEADHITLLYLADEADLLMGVKNEIIECLACIAKECMPVVGKLNGYGRFAGSNEFYPVYANYDSPTLFKLRAKMLWKIGELNIELPEEHGFMPHLTLGYLPAFTEMPQLDILPMAMNFGTVALIWGGERIDFVLAGQGERYEEEDDEGGKVEIEISVKDTGNALKAITKTDTELRVANYLAMFGGRDLEGIASTRKNKDGSIGEYFTKSTAFASPYTDVGVLYVDWEHGIGQDGIAGDDVLGYVDWKSARMDEKGLWVERILNRKNRYVQWLEDLIEAGAIGTSSEAISEGVVKGANGEIKAWPLRRDSLTVTPMDWRMASQNTLVALKALADHVPAIKSILNETGSLPDQITTDSEPEPEATEPETFAQNVVQAAADGEQERRENAAAERLLLELDLLLLEE
jgi:2'-5' RNA ligase